MPSNISRRLRRPVCRVIRSDLPSKPSSICSTCWEGPIAARFGLFGQPMRKTWGAIGHRVVGGYAYSISYSQLEDRAAAECNWCRFVLSILKREDFKVKNSKKSLKIAVGSPDKRPALPFYIPPDTQVLLIAISLGRELRFFETFVHAAADGLAAPHIVARSPTLDEIGSISALALASECIDECVNSHPHCVSFSTDPLLPTRIIDCTNPDHLRLFSAGGGRGRYLALSYVWGLGETQPHQTTSSNVSTYADGIDPAILPQTIRDAVYITRALGIDYLWVDSLCIIQDSGEDKRHEIGRMHLTYRYAYLTIIAASARNVRDGFLQERSPAAHDAVLPFLCPAHPPAPSGEATDGFDTQWQVGKVHVCPGDTCLEWYTEPYDLRQEPVSARGWCLLEYYMSPRVLAFASNTLQFRCQTTSRTVGNTFYSPHGERWLPHVLFQSDPTPRLKGDSTGWKEVYRAWQEVVHDYSRRTVSKPSDKLVACGALAEVFHRVLQSDYLAGMWRATILWDLLWKSDTPGKYLHRPAEYRAPSWSWASVDGSIETGGPSFLSDATVTAAARRARGEVVLEDPELPFGRVTSGSLDLYTSFVPCKLPPNADMRRDVVLKTKRDLYTRSPVVEDKTLPGWAVIDTEADDGIESAWIAPLLRSKDSGLVYGLVVAPAGMDGSTLETSSTERLYRRAGMFCVEDWHVEWPTSPTKEVYPEFHKATIV